jgi:hypothetical protein
MSLPITPAQFKKMDADPRASAEAIYEWAPKTMNALILVYCEAYADDAPPGRHVETADVTGDRL